MALSQIFYENPSLFALSFPPPAQAFVTKCIESSDAADMEARVQQALDEVTALNVLIAAAFPDEPTLLLTLADMSLAGGGDGYEFITMLNFVPESLNSLADLLTLDPSLLVPGSFKFTFALAGESSELVPVVNAAIARAAGAEDTNVLFQALAGSAKGTRFMYGVGGLTEGGGPQLSGRIAEFRSRLRAARPAE